MGYVYFVRPVGQSGPIKIGYSRVPSSRAVHLQSWSPVALEMIGCVEAAPDVEPRLHAYLLAERSHCEWFHSSPLVLTTVAALLDGSFDVETLPEPQDIRAKSGSKDGGVGVLASILSRALQRAAKVGHAVPLDVREAQVRFSNNPYLPKTYREGGRVKADAEMVVAYLRSIGRPAVSAEKRVAELVA